MTTRPSSRPPPAAPANGVSLELVSGKPARPCTVEEIAQKLRAALLATSASGADQQAALRILVLDVAKKYPVNIVKELDQLCDDIRYQKDSRSVVEMEYEETKTIADICRELKVVIAQANAQLAFALEYHVLDGASQRAACRLLDVTAARRRNLTQMIKNIGRDEHDKGIGQRKKTNIQTIVFPDMKVFDNKIKNAVGRSVRTVHRDVLVRLNQVMNSAASAGKSRLPEELASKWGATEALLQQMKKPLGEVEERDGDQLLRAATAAFFAGLQPLIALFVDDAVPKALQRVVELDPDGSGGAVLQDCRALGDLLDRVLLVMDDLPEDATDFARFSRAYGNLKQVASTQPEQVLLAASRPSDHRGM